MDQKTYDLIIIGGGPAGYLAAERASKEGLSVAVFEKRSLGGVCLNEGCIPTKSLLNSAKIYAKTAHGKVYGVNAQEMKLDHMCVIQRKNEVVKTLVEGVKAKMYTSKVEVIPAVASIKGKTAEGFIVTANRKDYTAKNILLAAGSDAIVPPILGLADALQKGFAYTSREILNIDHLPKKLIIIGGGVIGLEMAYYFCMAGVQVTVIEMLNKIAGPVDAELSKILLNSLVRNGVEFHLNSRVIEFENGIVAALKGGKRFKIETDAVLLSIGRCPSTDGLGLETIGIYTERGAVVTDNHMRTNISNVYAAGDINGKSMLAHTAYREAEVAINNILGKKDLMSYDVIPSVIYTTPEVATIGETEDTAKEKGFSFEIKKLSMAYSGRYVAENEYADGVCKVIVEKGTERLLGVQLIGIYASEIILAAGVMIESRLPLESLKKIVFAHPTEGEIIRETIFN